MSRLIKEGFDVLLETNGSLNISGIHEKIKIVMDSKLPSSGEESSMNKKNYGYLKKKDELKFVISNRKDFEAAKKVLLKHRIHAGEILFSPVRKRISFHRLSEWVKKELPLARVQSNLHKVFMIR
ncbi:hypothetical protein ACFLR5_00130 [Elusimicrobiota bacterium]